VIEVVKRYRLHAASCIESAQQLSDKESKLALLQMAQSWLALAEQAAKNSEAADPPSFGG
jgi:putative IMPACT (imprinted ancient) family translation regulator